ncbi:Hypothetical protein RBRH_01119 [Mycetohabitans rhizoxinica HKI 454]|uniref:DUF29 domain-containing protein n=1 Tax=Mycetohabitans rhizoxinica (strain DSM 19002 / CIP 109453 / HKI 454) TaxID=882378 RepID=E5AP25_MYCRK|nr:MULTISPECIES: DUF29 domain-containing protein [Mycetohabitans]MCF7695197.1 DUF29 domain-containing protein [Mycetohabitans sp. B2]MCG1046577.1 DUF29 domain-containing protein [Mycetohabitans sp. B6]CBW74356.1 Hypothetical protein RBRH_01119 [Mycetohabitans rhizoxinica HKI 454]
MGTSYDEDVIAWANEQAALLRAGKLSAIDIEHIAEEIEDVGKSEQRELANRMAILLAHLLKWEFQSKRRGASWEAKIHTQRNGIERRIRKTPSLKASLNDPDWWADAWDDAVEAASKETGLSYTTFPETCPWSMEQTLDPTFFPDRPQ